MDKQWILLKKGAEYEKICSKFNISMVLARLLRNRELLTEEDVRIFLDGKLEDMYSPFLMKNMKESVELMKQKILDKKPIRIVGDYDIDGIMSTYILHSALKELGANVDVKIPHRMKEGYGLNASIIEECREDGIDTILTCDNGIAAIEEITLAKKYNMTVVVTDHHEIPFEELEEDGEYKKNYKLPPADYIVNPHQADCNYPFPDICGGLVAYKFVQALFCVFSKPDNEVEKYLEYAAFATVGDVMELKGENRIVVKYGLEKMKNTSNPGLKALICEKELLGKEITPYHIGFVLGPCINASGRLDTARMSLQLLESDYEQAKEIAKQLSAINDARKNLTSQALEEAERQMQENHLDDNNVLVLFLPDCHESIAGLVASRIKEKYYKPTIVLTKGEEGIKGSGRSIPGYSMYEELVKCKELFSKFGGHPMAAGMSLAGEDYKELSGKLNEYETLTEKELRPTVKLDMLLPFSYLSEQLILELDRLEPTGNGNARPLFGCKNVKIISRKSMGANNQYARLTLDDNSGQRVEAVVFQNAEKLLESDVDELTIAYRPQMNEFRGKKTIQIVIEEYL